jgi:hypothetical protein
MLKFTLKIITGIMIMAAGGVRGKSFWISFVLLVGSMFVMDMIYRLGRKDAENEFKSLKAN